MEDSKKAIKSLLEGFRSYVQTCFRSAPFMVMKFGIIENALENNKYSVRTQGMVFTIPCCTDQKFKAGDTVRLLCAQNDSNTKVIIGRG